MELCKLVVIVAAVVGVADVVTASKKKSSSSSGAITYNEKQKGDYNIRLHMKDFQIIALLGDDPLSGFDDYDYSYDYADLTVKPVLPSFTLAPSRPSNDSGADNDSSTHRPSDDVTFTKPATARPQNAADLLLLLAQQGLPPAVPLELPASVEHKITNAQINITISGGKVTTTTEKSSVDEQTPAQELSIPVVVLQPTSEPESVGTTNETAAASSNPEKGDVAQQQPNQNATSQPKPFLYVPQILFVPKGTTDRKEANDTVADEDGDKKDDRSEENDRLVPEPVGNATNKRDDETSMAATLPVKKRPGFSSGNVRMCALGFARDKRGRCRRVRKPGQQFQYGVRLANMANRLKNAMKSETSS